MARYRKYKWRVYADNNIEKQVIDHLRASGMDVLWIAERPQLRRQQDDEFHYMRARQLRRYLLTHDLDFWDDHRFPLKDSPGVIILTSGDTEASKYLPVLLRKLIDDYNPLEEPLYLDGLKIKLGEEGITIKGIDRDTQNLMCDFQGMPHRERFGTMRDINHLIDLGGPRWSEMILSSMSIVGYATYIKRWSATSDSVNGVLPLP